MLNAVECLAKAAEMNALALASVDKATADAFTEMANTWRRNAVIARQQEAWDALHPRD